MLSIVFMALRRRGTSPPRPCQPLCFREPEPTLDWSCRLNWAASNGPVASGICEIKVHPSIWHPYHLLRAVGSLKEIRLGNFSFGCLWQTRLSGASPLPQATLRWRPIDGLLWLLCPQGPRSLSVPLALNPGVCVNVLGCTTTSWYVYRSISSLWLSQETSRGRCGDAKLLCGLREPHYVTEVKKKKKIK